MDLRTLLLLILNALQRLMLPRAAPSAARPAHGPAHPWVRAHATQSQARRAPTPRELARPARPPLPPHLAALLAQAPAVEPDLAPRPRPAPFHTFRNIAVRVRVYNPKPPAPDLRAAAPTPTSWADRLHRAVAAFRSALGSDGPPRAAPTAAV